MQTREGEAILGEWCSFVNEHKGAFGSRIADVGRAAKAVYEKTKVAFPPESRMRLRLPGHLVDEAGGPLLEDHEPKARS